MEKLKNTLEISKMPTDSEPLFILYKAFSSKDCRVELLNLPVSLDNGFKI